MTSQNSGKRDSKQRMVVGPFHRTPQICKQERKFDSQWKGKGDVYWSLWAAPCPRVAGRSRTNLLRTTWLLLRHLSDYQCLYVWLVSLVLIADQICAVWAMANPHHIWLISQPTTLLCHLCNCELHSNDIWSHTQQEYHTDSLNKGMHHHTLLPPAVTIQPTPLAVLPQHGSHDTSICQLLLMWPSLPMLLIPVATTLNLVDASLYGSLSLPSSPVLSDISSHYSKWQ